MATDSLQAAQNQAVRELLKEQARTVWPIRLQAHMDALDVPVQALADGAGTTYQTIWKLLQGKLIPREYLRISIALALGTDVEKLFPLPTREAIVERTRRAA